MNMMWRNKLVFLFGIDLRTLALFRIGLASLILYDIFFLRLPYLSAHYTDLGILPRSVAIALLNNEWLFSLHFASGTAWFQGLLFLILIAVALSMLVGYRTRLMQLCTFVLLVSLQNRNPLISDGPDTLLIILMFWGLFLPLGARLSVDSALSNNTQNLDKPHFSIATAAILVQVMCVYFFTACLKSHDAWWPDGRAIYYALNIDQFTAAPGVWLRQFDQLTQALTYFVIIFEYVAALLIFLPVFSLSARLLTLICLIFMHLGFFFFMDVGLFPATSLVSLSLFIPGKVWDWAGQRWPKPGETGHTVRQAIQTHVPKHITNTPVRLHNPLLINLLAGSLLIYILGWNIMTTQSPVNNVPALLEIPAKLFRLDQRWRMFAPIPARDDGWFVMRGELKNGEIVDVFNQEFGEPSTEKPANVAKTFANSRWKRYLRRLWKKRYKNMRQYYARYICRTWNAKYLDEQRLETFTIVYHKELTLPQPPFTVEPVTIWTHACFGKPDKPKTPSPQKS